MYIYICKSDVIFLFFSLLSVANTKIKKVWYENRKRCDCCWSNNFYDSLLPSCYSTGWPCSRRPRLNWSRPCSRSRRPARRSRWSADGWRRRVRATDWLAWGRCRAGGGDGRRMGFRGGWVAAGACVDLD